MTLLISENWRRALAAVVVAVVLVGLGVAIGSVSSSSGSTPSATRTVTTIATKTVTAHAPPTKPGSSTSAQVAKLKSELAASGAQVKTLQRQLRVTRDRNKQLRARLAGHTTTKGK